MASHSKSYFEMEFHTQSHLQIFR